MKKIVFASLLLFGMAAVTHAQTPAKTSTQKKEVIKPASSVTTAPSAAKKTTAKTASPASSAKVNAANIGKHKRKHHKAAKKPAKKS